MDERTGKIEVSDRWGTSCKEEALHQKKKTVTIVLVVLFFAAAGAWYVLFGSRMAVSQDEEMPPESVFDVPEEPTAAQETVPTDTPAPTPIPTKTPVPTPIPDWYVYVCGAVKNPGVYRLAAGSRLYEAVEKAGGFTEQADEEYHNLVRLIADGERIYILSEEETKELSAKEKQAGEPYTEFTQNGKENDGTGSAGREEDNFPVNINTAGIQELMTLPGIGEAKAESILEYRSSVGKFLAGEELMNISGIGEAMFAKIKDKITVE